MIDIVFQVRGVNIGTISYSLEKFYSFLENNLSIPELERSMTFANFDNKSNKKLIFKEMLNTQVFIGALGLI